MEGGGLVELGVLGLYLMDQGQRLVKGKEGY